MKPCALPLVLALSLVLSGCGDDPSVTRLSPDVAPGSDARGSEREEGDWPDGCVVDPGPRVVRYRVKRGDTLIGIAREMYGDAALWREIVRANPAVVGPDADVRVGDELVIPFEGR